MVSFPYSYYRCSCTGERQQRGTRPPVPSPASPDVEEEEVEDQDETFDPGDARSDYSLYPLETLMWCEDCHDIRCPRCTVEEIVCWYCPNCLFEVPSSTVRSEGNRCTRNCFNCPECTSQLAINSLDPDPNSTAGPYVLLCNYCNWNSLDIGLKFSTPRYIYNQLQQQSGGSGGTGSKAQQRLPSRVLETVPEPDTVGSDSSGRNVSSRDASPNTADARKPQDPVVRFNALKTFYKTTLNASSNSEGIYTSDMNYGSPGHLARVLAMYSSARSGAPKAAGTGGKPAPMREVVDVSEGLSIFSPEADSARVKRLQEHGWQGTATGAQKAEQQLGVASTAAGSGSTTRFLADLKPVPTLLRTKRSSRCRACRHILVKPEAKVASTRYRIKLAANEHVPLMDLATLPDQQHYRDAALDLKALPPSRTLQFLLKVTNPMFDTPVRMTLATPAETPGRGDGLPGSRITILCPQFEVGANMDVWDEALKGGSRTLKTGAGEGEGKVAEAGKVWDRGRNWTSVVVEVVPKRIQKKTEELDEDEDVLEIPIFVRLESDVRKEEEGGSVTTGADKKKKGDLSYWTVLGVGRIATESAATTASS